MKTTVGWGGEQSFILILDRVLVCYIISGLSALIFLFFTKGPMALFLK